MSELRIDAVETVILDVPLRRPHRFARVSMEAQPVLLVFLRTEGGVTGVGEGHRAGRAVVGRRVGRDHAGDHRSVRRAAAAGPAL